MPSAGEVYFALDLKTGGDLEYYLLHMNRRVHKLVGVPE